MSRIELKPKNEKHEVVVGLDRPMSSYFITVTWRQDEDDEEDLRPVEFKSQWRTQEVISKIEQYAVENPLRKSVIDAIYLDIDPAENIKGSA